MSFEDPKAEYRFSIPSQVEHYSQCRNPSLLQAFQTSIKRKSFGSISKRRSSRPSRSSRGSREGGDVPAKPIKKKRFVCPEEQEEERDLIEEVADIMIAFQLESRHTDCCYEKTAFKVPNHVLGKYKNLRLPRCIYTKRMLLRPLIFFDIEVMGTECHGRIAIELYAEASPAVVLEFVRTCVENRNDFFSFTKSTAFWLEAQLSLPNATQRSCWTEYDMRALDHAAGTGVLSFDALYLDGRPHDELTFSLSYRPLHAMNGKRVAFGIVLLGLKTLLYIQHYALLHEGNMERFVVKKCGLISR